MHRCTSLTKNKTMAVKVWTNTCDESLCKSNCPCNLL